MDASQNSPAFGLFNLLEQVVHLCQPCPEAMKKVLKEEFLKICLLGNAFAAPVVNASSPEGFVPEMEETRNLMGWVPIRFPRKLLFFD